MAQNVIIAGVTYQSVPEVDIPTENGTAKFFDTSDADAAAGNLLTGKSAYGSSGKINGSMANRGALSSTISTPGGTVTGSAGYYSGISVSLDATEAAKITAANIKDGVSVLGVTGSFTDASTVSSGQTAAAAGQILDGYSAFVDGAEVQGSIASDDTPTPSITVNASTGLITATNSGTVTGYYIPAGSSAKSATEQLTTLAATNYNASNDGDRTIAAGQYLTGAQTIRGVVYSNITAANIKSGTRVTLGDTGSATRLLNVTGTFTAASTVSSGQTAATAASIISGYSAWVDGAEVKGTAVMPVISQNSTTKVLSIS